MRPKCLFSLGLLLALILLLAGLLAIPAEAAEFRSGDTVTIGPNEVINDDLWVSAGTVIMNGTVNGDLWVTGGQVRINGTVNGSLFFAGQSLALQGRVIGSLYAAGSLVTLGPRAAVARNAYFLGLALTARPGSSVARDLLAAGSQARLDGTVIRNASFAGSALDINGTVGGDVRARVGAPNQQTWVPPFTGPDTPALAPAGLRVGPRAQIGGRLIYTSPVDQSANIKSLPRGGVVFRQEQRRILTPGQAAARWALGWFREFVTLLALGALALWGFGAPLTALADKLRDRPWRSLGWGILIVIIGYAAALAAAIAILIVGGILAALTLSGLALAVLGGAGAAWALGLAVFLLAVAYGSKIVVSYLLGKLVLQRLAGMPGEQHIWLLLVGVAIFSLLRSIPYAGWFIDLLAALFGLGAIYLVFRDSSVQPQRPA